MPILKKKSPPPSHWPLVFGAATGDSANDFYVLGYSPDLDEHEKKTNPLHQHFTFIIHFHNKKRYVISKISERIEDIWLSPSGHIYAAGAPRGILSVTPDGCTETGLPDIPGTFESIWGISEDHIFTCGSYRPFMFYRRFGSWQQMSLPDGTGNLRDIEGFNENDVYCVGDNGQILHFDGRHIKTLESPTTRHLVSIRRLNEKLICIGGYTGILLFGNKEGWRFLPSGTEEPILNIARLGNSVCYATAEGIWSFNGNAAPFKLLNRKARWISEVGDAVIIVDGDNAWLFDGKELIYLDTML